ncbi:Ger(x)C family spore germination protein [Paenibacillus sp. YPG26]|uniref:Ger(x)C family spore germination protein n=1 Tax=Paenibacillus sp. YPG26 TaxID=2878915 RepID=UPI00203C104A|nr:Ger(x)C family spore germination protein [Paenibacillus sp. YPG26]USB31735.1 Ger(x)C family spore germination protein [Paenibacillus sp. YPG26]
MRRLGIGIVMLMLLLVLTGCWNRIELNELGIVVGTGVDYKDGEWVISYQMIAASSTASGGSSSSGGSSQSSVNVFSVNSKTIHQALNLSNLENPRYIYVAHNKVVVIGKSAAEHGIGELMDYYLRNSQPRETVLMTLTEGRAIDILNKLSPPERLPGSSISDMLNKENRQVSVFPIINVFKFALAMSSDAKGVRVPVIELAGDKSENNEEELTTEDVLKHTQPPLKLKITKLGVFRGDRLAGLLDYNESLGVSWITGDINRTEFSFPCSREGSPGERAGYSVNSSKTKITPKKSGSRYVMHIKVTMKGNLTESTCQLDLSSSKVINELEAQINQRVENDIHTGWAAMKRLKTDAAGFADRIHRKFPSDWREIKESWEDKWSQMDLDIQVQATIRRSGLIQKSFEFSQEK